MKSKWFEDAFLQSIFDRIGHDTRWLTAKQTSICTQYMERRTARIETATGYNNHDNYVYNWNGREVVLSYSKKNGCGTIWFGLNDEEQKQAQIENEAEKRQQIIETAQRRMKRSPERYYATIEKMKAKIKSYQQEIEESKEEGDTGGLENLVSYVENLKHELALWESVIG
jgi:DNA repair exonuclease SbcCD ATPase subunit